MGYFSKLRSSLSSSDFGLFRFLVVGATGLVVNSLCLLGFVELGGLNYLLSVGLATQCSTLWNFALTEIWVFRERDPGRSLLGRFARFYLMNNAALLLRTPLFLLVVSALGVHYLAGNVLSLFMLAVLRYLLSSMWIWIPTAGGDVMDRLLYDIHGIITVESEVRLPELEYFRVEKISSPPDLRLRAERRKRPRGSDQAIRYDDGLGKFGFALSIVPGECTEIQVSSLVKNSPHVLYTNVFEPLLRWTFVRKGYALVHAACIAHQGQGLLITARTDTGKTTTILRTLDERNYAFLSDDMTILGRDGRLMNYPKPLTISAHTLRAVPHARLLLRERLVLQLQSRLHSRSGRKIALWLMHTGLPAATINAIVQILVPPPKYPITRLIPDIGISKVAQLTKIVEIKRGEEQQEVMGMSQMIDRLFHNAEDAYGFPPYPELRPALSQWLGVDLHPHERGIIEEAVKGCRAWGLRSENYAWWKMIPRIMEDHPAPALSLMNSLELHELDTRPIL